MVFSKLAMTIAMALVLFIFIYESECASYNSSSSQIDDDKIPSFSHKKVNLSVYYESLSESCATFIIKDLEGIFNNDLINIVNLQLLPWANAYINSTNNNSISCQKGADECELNSVEACALNHWSNNVNKYYAVISCLELMALDGNNKNWKDCLNQLGLPVKPILNCLNCGNGTELGRKYIHETAQLCPPPSFLPWVVVNNQPIGEDYENFTYYVCKAYRGVAVPAACNYRLK